MGKACTQAGTLVLVLKIGLGDHGSKEEGETHNTKENVAKRGDIQ